MFGNIGSALRQPTPMPMSGGAFNPWTNPGAGGAAIGQLAPWASPSLSGGPVSTMPQPGSSPFSMFQGGSPHPMPQPTGLGFLGGAMPQPQPMPGYMPPPHPAAGGMQPPNMSIMQQLQAILGGARGASPAPAPQPRFGGVQMPQYQAPTMRSMPFMGNFGARAMM